MLIAVIVALVMMLAIRTSGGAKSATAMTAEEAREFRERAEDAVFRAPEAFRYNVWKGVNARLLERGLEPIERPEGLVEE